MKLVLMCQYFWRARGELMLPALPRSLITDHNSWADLEMLALLYCIGNGLLTKMSSSAFYKRRSPICCLKLEQKSARGWASFDPATVTLKLPFCFRLGPLGLKTPHFSSCAPTATNTSTKMQQDPPPRYNIVCIMMFTLVKSPIKGVTTSITGSWFSGIILP